MLAFGVLLLSAGSCAGVNLWLNTDHFSNRINDRSRHVRIEWDRASMIWPGRLQVRGLRIRGDNRSVQWSVDLSQAIADIDLLALNSRQFRTSRLRGSGLSYRMRRRQLAAKSKDAQHLPEIDGLELTPEADHLPTPSTRPPGFRFDLEGVDVHDVQEVWIDATRVTGSGRLAGDMHFQVRGPVALHAMLLAFDAGSVWMESEPVSGNLALDLELELDPLMPRGARIADVLGAASGRIQMSGDVSGLGFLRNYMGHASDLRVTGEGRLEGDVRLDHGLLDPGTTFRVDAARLGATLPKFAYHGAGTIEGSVEAGASEGTEGTVTVALRDLGVVMPGRAEDVVQSGVDVVARARNPSLLEGFTDPEIQLRVVGFQIPDLSAFGGVLPERSGIDGISGGASIDASLVLGSGQGATGDVLIRGHDVVVDVNGHPLELTMAIDVPHRARADGTRVSIDGTELRFSGPLPSATTTAATDSWSARLEVLEGTMSLNAPREAGLEHWTSLRPVDGHLLMSGHLTDLAGIEKVFRHGDWLRLSGAVDLSADLDVRRRRISPGSEIDLNADRLRAQLLGWTFDGKASIRGQVLPGDARGKTALNVDFQEVQIAKDGLPFGSSSGFRLRALGPEIESKSRSIPGGRPEVQDFDIAFELEPANVLDLTTLNRFLPHPDTLSIRGGQGALEGEGRLVAGIGAARFKLSAESASATIHGGALTTDLNVDIQLESDDPASRRLRIPEMTLSLGPAFGAASSSYGEDPWFGEFRLEDANLQLGTPPALDGRARLKLMDTRPLTRLLEESYPALQWFERWLTLQDVQGSAQIKLDAEGIRLDAVDLESERASLTGSLQLAPPTENGPRHIKGVRARGELKRPLEVEVEMLNDFLQRDGVLQFISGIGDLTGFVDVAEDSVVGAIDLAGRNLQLALRGEPVQADVLFDIALQSQDLTSREFDFADTTLRLDHTRWIGKGADPDRPDWWGQLAVTEGVLVLGTPLEATASVDIHLRDTAPLVHMLAETNRAVRWFHRMLEVQDVKGTARVQMSGDGLRIEAFKIAGEHLKLEGHMDFGEGREYALFHLRLHGIGLSVELEQGEHRFTLFEPRKWYAKKLAARLSAEGPG